MFSYFFIHHECKESRKMLDLMAIQMSKSLIFFHNYVFKAKSRSPLETLYLIYLFVITTWGNIFSFIIYTTCSFWNSWGFFSTFLSQTNCLKWYICCFTACICLVYYDFSNVIMHSLLYITLFKTLSILCWLFSALDKHFLYIVYLNDMHLSYIIY